MSLPNFVRMSNGAVRSVDEIPFSHFILRVDPGAKGTQLDKLNADLASALISSGLSSAASDSNETPSGFLIFDFREALDPLSTVNEVLDLVFGITVVIAMAISFFSLSSSMYSNIMEQSKEIFILRSIGLSKSWIRRVYLYEGFILVFVSSFLGVFIGTIVAYTMFLQQALFTQIPQPFIFPWELMLVVSLLSILFSFLASFKPLNNLLSKQPVEIGRVIT